MKQNYGARVDNNESHTTTFSVDKTYNINTCVDRNNADHDIPTSVISDLTYDYARV